MSKFLFLIWSLLCFGIMQAQYVPDELGKAFEKRTIIMPDDYEGKVVCTLIRHKAKQSDQKAILYVHGYNDYFFQTEMANRFSKAGYRFYAVDLRKYGRSILRGQFATNARQMNEYFADIDTSLNIIRKEGVKKIILIGHSTGGLITSLYADRKGQKLNIDGLILNSPFFDFNENYFTENISIPVVSCLSYCFKNTILKGGGDCAYGESLHKDFRGEWNFDLRKKSVVPRDKRWCWIGAIDRAQIQVQKGLQINCPVLAMSSDKSIVGEPWNVGYQTADGVLDVQDIQRYSRNIGKKTTLCIVPGGMHDLVLSKKNVRAAVYREMFSWLNKNGL